MLFGYGVPAAAAQQCGRVMVQCLLWLDIPKFGAQEASLCALPCTQYRSPSSISSYSHTAEDGRNVCAIVFCTTVLIGGIKSQTSVMNIVSPDPP